MSETRSQNLNLKSLNKRGAPKLLAFSKITQPLTFVLSNILETRSWIQNLRSDLKSWKKRCPIEQYCVNKIKIAFSSHSITFYTTNSYHSTNLIQYKGLGVSHFAAFFLLQFVVTNWRSKKTKIFLQTWSTFDKNPLLLLTVFSPKKI